MKFRVIFLKKKSIIYFIIFFILLLLFSCFLLQNKNTTVLNITEENTIKEDLTGDGQEDILKIKTNNNKYYIEVNTKDKTFILEPDKNISTLGFFSESWPIKISLIDISRDKIPEIFVQSSYKENPLQHVFFWNGQKFENMYSNSNNILGFIDYSNNKTTKIVSGKIINSNIYFDNYIFLNYKFKSYNLQSTNSFMGKDSVMTFINFIQSLPNEEDKRPIDIFDPKISGKSLSKIGMLSGENKSYIFQDATFMDTRCDENGGVSELKWNLNFRGVSNLDKSIVKNYTITILLKPFKDSTQGFYFKISSINLK